MEGSREEDQKADKLATKGVVVKTHAHAGGLKQPDSAVFSAAESS